MVNFIRQEKMEMDRNSERGHSCAHLCFRIHYFYAAVIKHHNLKQLIEKKKSLYGSRRNKSIQCGESMVAGAGSWELTSSPTDTKQK